MRYWQRLGDDVCGIEGNLVRDPELAYTAKGAAVCKFTLGCNRS
jgi:single-stranded DNA-binding protein